MTEENNTPKPQWITELKKWGIDVETFDTQWEQAGADAKAQFQKALVSAKEQYESGKVDFEAKMGDVSEDVKEFVQQLNTAWDEMISNIREQLSPDSQDNKDA